MGKGANFSSPLRIDGKTIVDESGEVIVDGGISIVDGSISIEHLDAGIKPAYIVKFAGKFTTAGGDANETVTVTGALASDIAIATIADNGTNDVTLLQTVAVEDAVNFTLSANPGTDCIINYMVLRAAE